MQPSTAALALAALALATTPNAHHAPYDPWAVSVWYPPRVPVVAPTVQPPPGVTVLAD